MPSLPSWRQACVKHTHPSRDTLKLSQNSGQWCEGRSRVPRGALAGLEASEGAVLREPTGSGGAGGE